MHCKEAYTAVVQGIIDGTSKHVLLNNVVSNYFIDFGEIERFYDLTIKLVRKVRSETGRDL